MRDEVMSEHVTHVVMTPRQRALLDAMCRIERRRVSDMIRVLIEEGAERRGLDGQQNQKGVGR